MSDQNKDKPEGAGKDEPDIDFRISLGGDTDPEPAASADEVEPGVAVEGRDRALAREIADVLGEAGPPDWRQFDAVFALTTTTMFAEVVYADQERSMRTEPSGSVLDRVREHRALVAELDGEPWWRLLLRRSSDGDFEVDYDFGEEPFPDGQLFEPDAYRADLDEFPRDSLPVWLAAYIGHADRQMRSPQEAARDARADRAAKVWPTMAENEFPDFPEMWARWACISAGFVAAGSDWGPRILPAMGWFESSRRGGSTLYSLPGGRAVLSGGVWEAANLDAAYNDGAGMPNFFAGAPEWVADPVLNPRSATGLLSFVYWWEGGRWYRGDSPSAEACATAVPGVWTVDTVAGILAGLAAQPPTAQHRAAAGALISAAEIGVVTRDTVLALFGDEEQFDIDGAMYQLTLAGVVASLPVQMPEDEAVFRVRGYIESRGLDTTGYPLDQLVADRFSCGWMVYVPVPRGEIAIGRAIFYIADDGVLEHSSSSIAPTTFVKEFEQRYHERRGVTV
ncbi:hypothetical protein [Nocardia fusca]|uniref:hypothetical protein n=1 Tax=Nocardia fusca TaxID=941183 RepID=UPI000ADA3AEE|nr:hypothetical protein [Nocardia fusca]